MNRAQRRKIIRMAGKPKKPEKPTVTAVSAANAQALVDNMPVPQIVAGINNLFSQLEQRGIPVYDWDDEGRRLYRLQMRRGKIYYLAAGPESADPEPEINTP